MNNIVQEIALLSLFFCKIQLMLNKICHGSGPSLYEEMEHLPAYLGFEILTSYLRWYETLTTTFFLPQTKGNHSFATIGNTPHQLMGLKVVALHAHIIYSSDSCLQSFALVFLESAALQEGPLQSVKHCLIYFLVLLQIFVLNNPDLTFVNDVKQKYFQMNISFFPIQECDVMFIMVEKYCRDQARSMKL